MGEQLLVLGRWSVDVSVLMTGIVVLLSLWLFICVVIQRLLAWRAVACALAETSWDEAQRWEIKAMAAFVYKRLPWWINCFVGEMELEEAAAAEWRALVMWYQEHRPREDANLFGDTGPW